MRIAIIGSGISGLGALHILGRRYPTGVHVYEAAERIGGHTHTHAIPHGAGTDQVDTGFIVYNPLNYPLFCRLLEELGVTGRETTMSFSVVNDADGLCYNGTSINGLLAQRRNLLRPRFWGLVRDIMRFNKLIPGCLDADVSLTLETFLTQHRFGSWLKHNYIVPMTASIWSASATEVGRMPMRFLARFLNNHHMDRVDDRPVWRTVRGGSRTYVDRLVEPYPGAIRRNSPVQKVLRQADGVDVHVAGQEGPQRYDKVIFACHADTTLRLLADADALEREVLGSFSFADNEAVLHRDLAWMPPVRRGWAAWNYQVVDAASDAVAVTYNMNMLQGIDEARPYLVTLNPHQQIADDQVIARMVYQHPQFDSAAVAAQDRHDEIDGRGGIHHSGAWWGFGFHEDGFASAVRVCKNLGVDW